MIKADIDNKFDSQIYDTASIIKLVNILNCICLRDSILLIRDSVFATDRDKNNANITKLLSSTDERLAQTVLMSRSIQYCRNCGNPVFNISFKKKGEYYYIYCSKKNRNIIKIKLSPMLCYDILKMMSDDDCKLIGFNTRPERLFDGIY